VNGGGGRLHSARYGVDGDPATDAQAAGEYAWTYEVDLVETTKISRVVLTFGKSYATQFEVQVAPNSLLTPVAGQDLSWQTVAKVEDHDGSRKELRFEPIVARYLRVRALKPDGPNQKGGQMSVAELEIYK
jgi:hypothetical protein